MTDKTSKMAARYLARAFAEYRVMQKAAYTTETAEGYTAYRSAINSLLDAQDISGVEMIPGDELKESIRWCNRMAEKIDTLREPTPDELLAFNAAVQAGKFNL